jgi:hypothetical protein
MIPTTDTMITYEPKTARRVSTRPRRGWFRRRANPRPRSAITGTMIAV